MSFLFFLFSLFFCCLISLLVPVTSSALGIEGVDVDVGRQSGRTLWRNNDTRTSKSETNTYFGLKRGRFSATERAMNRSDHSIESFVHWQRVRDGLFESSMEGEVRKGVKAQNWKRIGRGLKTSSSSSAAMELKGKAREDGYFYVEMQIGTPGVSFEVIVDTGSTYTFVTCDGCGPQKCGTHDDAKVYDQTRSSSYRRVGCGQGCIFGQCGVNGLCEYEEHFSEDSEVGGHLVSDVIDVGGSLGNPRINFGCNTLETNMLKTQRAVGLIAFGRSESGIHRQLKKKAYPPGSYDGTFGLCLGSFEGGGVLSLGKLPEQHYLNFVTRKTETKTIKLVKGTKSQYYNVEVKRIFVRDTELFDQDDGQTLLIPKFHAGFGTVIDSGTTYTYFHEDVFIPFISAIEEKVVNDFGTDEMMKIGGGDPINYPNDVCWRSLNENKLLTVNNINYMFPNFTLTFFGVNDEEVPISFPAENYLFIHPTVDNAFCVGVFDNGRAGTIIGGIFARNVLFEFDDESVQQTLKISPNVKCDDLRDALDFDEVTGAMRHPPPPPLPTAPTSPGTPGTGISQTSRNEAYEARKVIMYKIMVGGLTVASALFAAMCGIARIYYWNWRKYRRFAQFIKLENDIEFEEGDEDDENGNEEIEMGTMNNNNINSNSGIDINDEDVRTTTHFSQHQHSSSAGGDNWFGAFMNAIGFRDSNKDSQNRSTTTSNNSRANPNFFAPISLREQTLNTNEKNKNSVVSERTASTRTGRLTETQQRPLQADVLLDSSSNDPGPSDDMKSVWKRFNLK